MEKVVIVSGFRTAIGKFGGTIKDIEASDLCAPTIRKNLEYTGINSKNIDEVIIGCVGQIAENYLISRMCTLKSGLPVEVPSLSVNRVCGSGLEAINLASLKITSGEANIIIAGGTENLDLYPFYMRKARYGYRFGHDLLEDGLKTVFTDSSAGLLMGEIGEKIAKKYKISRQEQDEYSFWSHRRALRAIKNGEFKDQIVPVEVQLKKEKVIFDTDEHPRETSMEQLSKLKPAFKKDGSVTAGNASGINDGAATVVAMADTIAKDYKIDPAVSIVTSVVSGCEPEFMGLGPIYSTKKALKKAGMEISDIDVFEINEAFASQVLAVIRELKIPMEKVNVNGGAIALGHPIGATGAILMVKIMNIMKKNNYEYGLISLCIGGGQGMTTILKLE